jgi:thiol-disulfide isomerase/thioredoxin
MVTSRTAAPLAALFLCVATASLALAQASPPDRRNDRTQERERKTQERENARRLEKLDPADRAAVQNAVGFAAPEFTGGLDWLGNEVPSMQSLRGKVVVLQTFTTRNAQARALPARLAKALADKAPELVGEVQLIVIHTPEGADRAATLLEKGELVAPTAIDRDGAFCDALGAFRKPVNFVVDRTGDVRFAGLTIDGVVEVAKELAAEPFDPANKPTARRPETSPAGTGFPVYRNAIRAARDLRGQQSPALGNVNWWTDAPAFDRRLVIVDFWATWCAPCRRAIPHMNQIATSFARDVVVIGLSDESSSNFQQGTRQHNIRKSDFAYAVGIDPSGAMKNGFGVTGIPHVAAISSDGVVRWQGHPDELTPDVVRALVEANNALAARGAGGAERGERWKRELENETARPRRGS